MRRKTASELLQLARRQESWAQRNRDRAAARDGVVPDEPLIAKIAETLTEHGPLSTNALARRLKRRRGDVAAACRVAQTRGTITRAENAWTLSSTTGNADAGSPRTIHNGVPRTEPSDTRAQGSQEQEPRRNTRRQNGGHTATPQRDEQTRRNAPTADACAREQNAQSGGAS